MMIMVKKDSISSKPNPIIIGFLFPNILLSNVCSINMRFLYGSKKSEFPIKQKNGQEFSPARQTEDKVVLMPTGIARLLFFY